MVVRKVMFIAFDLEQFVVLGLMVVQIDLAAQCLLEELPQKAIGVDWDLRPSK